MKCPHCKKEIKSKEVARHFASIGGSKSSEAKKVSNRANAYKRWHKDEKKEEVKNEVR